PASSVFRPLSTRGGSRPYQQPVRIPRVLEVSREPLRPLAAGELLDDVERGVEPGGEPGRGDDLSVVDEPPIVDHPHLRERAAQLVEERSVGGRRKPVEERVKAPLQTESTTFAAGA